MNHPLRHEADSFSDADLKRRREKIRRGLRRANTAAAVILLIVIGLSLAALLQALRAERNAHTAQSAFAQGRDELWKAQLARARAQRLSGLAGRKAESLAAVTAAASIRKSLDLRDEATAALALDDVTKEDNGPAAGNYSGLPLALAPDLDRYALGDGRGRVRVLRTSTAETLARFDGPVANLTNLRFSPEGGFLAAAFQNGDVVIWNLTNQQRVLTWNCGRVEAHRTSFDFSPDARLLVVACRTAQARILDLADQKELPALTLEAAASQVAFRPDGQMLGLAVSNRIELWHWPERTLAQRLEHPGEMVALAWHPDNRRLASSCWGTSDVLLWDTWTTNHLSLPGHAELIPQLFFDRSGEWLVSVSWDSSSRFWRGNDGQLLFVARGCSGTAFSLDDTKLAYFGEQQPLGMWNASRSTVYHEFALPIGAKAYISGFDFSPDGHSLAVANPDGLHLLDLPSGRERSFVPATNMLSVSFAADGRSAVAVASDQISLWRTPSGPAPQWLWERRFDLPARLSLDRGTVTRGGPPLLAVPSVEYVFFVDLRDPLSLRSLPGGGALGPLTCVALSPDTNWLATTYWKGGHGTAVWDMRARKKVQNLGAAGGFVAFSPDNRWLLVGSGHQYVLWDTSSWRRAREFERHAAGELVGRGAFSPDSGLMAICPEVNQVQLIETQSGRVLATLDAPTPKNIGWLAFSPNGSTLAASTFDNKIQLWNLPTLRRELAALGLDWSGEGAFERASADAPTLPRSMPRASPFGVKTFYLLDSLGVLLAVFIGLYTLQYHQRMVRNYEEVETLVAQRNRELELAQVELLHSQKMKALGTLAAGIAHDFNNLLSVIRMGNNFLRRPEISAEDKAESSRAVERAVEQGKKVVRSMLGYSREPAEGRHTFSVPEVVDEVMLMLSKEFLGGLTLTLELNPDTPLVKGARGRLEQIVLNLVVNAAEAMDGKGRLLIAVREAADGNGDFVLRPRPAERFVELLVADTGPGIDPSIQGRIFEPFFSTKPQSAASGTGLGLSLVHSLAEQEGMGIRLQSAPGEGTVFSILVPAETTRKSE